MSGPSVPRAGTEYFTVLWLQDINGIEVNNILIAFIYDLFSIRFETAPTSLDPGRPVPIKLPIHPSESIRKLFAALF